MMIVNKKLMHGGKRKGAGRPKQGKQKITLSLSPNTIAIARILGANTSEGIDNAVAGVIKMLNPTTIYINNEFLNFSTGAIACVKDYEYGDRCIGSIFETLASGDYVALKEGIFQLDDELDLID
jgi:hypothetical protein